jgi:hypothetical protein
VSKILSFLEAAVVILRLADIGYAYYKGIAREQKLRSALDKGVAPSPERPVVGRKEMAAGIKNILQPPDGYGGYILIEPRVSARLGMIVALSSMWIFRKMSRSLNI